MAEQHPWTTDEVSALRANAHLDVPEIALILNRSEGSVWKKASYEKIAIASGHASRKRGVDGFDRNIEFEPNTGCWLWSGSPSRDGYGVLRVKWKCWKAHRWSWVRTHGEIPPGLQVLHRCDTPACVNPDHLFLGTRSDNMRDMRIKGRHPVGWTRPKISPRTKEQVGKLLGEGVAVRVVARQFGIVPTSVRRIRDGRPKP